ncbi:MAG: hypothetical protein IPI49_24245 [Myxococcales bacterium]|nr:hypothetical protein [Myxococcales bacterium]
MVRRLVLSIVFVAGSRLAWGQPIPPQGPAEPPAAEPPAAEPAAGTPAEVTPASSRAAALEVGRAPPRRVLPALPAPQADAPSAAPTWQPFGYLRLQAALVQNDANVAFIGRSDGFDLQNARLGARGRLGQRAAFEVSIDGAVDERDQVNLPNGRLRVGLRDAHVDLPIAAELAVRAGRFEPWFDPEARDGDTERPFVDRALDSRGVLATEGWQAAGLTPGRSLGVAARWQRGKPWQGSGVAAEVSAQNGADEFASGNDNDALALSLAVRAWSAGLGWVQVAGRYNPRTEGDQPFRQDETDLAGALGMGASLGPVRLGAGAVLMRTTFATTGGGAQRAWGAHGQALVRVPAAGLLVEVGYRFAILDPSSLVLTDRVMEHTAGAVLSLPRLRARILAGAVHVAEQAARTLRNDRLEAVLEVSL